MANAEAVPPMAGADTDDPGDQPTAGPAPAGPKLRAAGFRRAKAVTTPAVGAVPESPLPPAAPTPAAPKQAAPTPAAEPKSAAEPEQATMPAAATPVVEVVDDDAPSVDAATAVDAATTMVEPDRPSHVTGRIGDRLRAVTGRVRSAPTGGGRGDVDGSQPAQPGRNRRRAVPVMIGVAVVAAGVPILLVQGTGEGTTRQASALPAPIGPGAPGIDDELVDLPGPAASSPSPSAGGVRQTAGPAPSSGGASRVASGTRTGAESKPSRYASPVPSRSTTAPVVPAPAPSPSPSTSTTTAVTGGLDYDAITGLGCKRDNSTQDYYTRGSGLSGWRTATSGGFGGYGCSGRYESMPLNGTSSHTDNRYMVWWFATSKVSTADCDLWIFIPKAADAADTAATAYFAVLPDKDSGSTVGTFTVNESSARGTWAHSGRRWPMRNGKLAVKLLDRGSGRASAAAALVKCYKA